MELAEAASRESGGSDELGGVLEDVAEEDSRASAQEVQTSSAKSAGVGLKDGQLRLLSAGWHRNPDSSR